MSRVGRRVHRDDQGDLDRGRRSTSTARCRPTISTGIPFYDHMLDQLGSHGGFDLRIAATGDLHIDTHHTVEDVAIALGEAFREALGDKAGVRRFASGLLPARRGAGRGRARPVGPAVRGVGRRAARVPAARQPAVRSAARRARRRRRSPRRPASRCTSRCVAAATCTTSSRRRSRAWRAACATPCASRAPQRAVDEGRAVTDEPTAADRGARLRHRQPALGAEGARARAAPTPGSPPTPG